MPWAQDKAWDGEGDDENNFPVGAGQQPHRIGGGRRVGGGSESTFRKADDEQKQFPPTGVTLLPTFGIRGAGECAWGGEGGISVATNNYL